MSGGGGGAVRAVKSQGGGAVAQWRKRACEWEGVLGRRASMGPTHVAWMCVGKGADPMTMQPRFTTVYDFVRRPGCCSAALANLHHGLMGEKTDQRSGKSLVSPAHCTSPRFDVLPR